MTSQTSQQTQGTGRRKSVTEGIGDNPLALLAGGVALGVLVGALLPRIAKERELLDPIGRKLADSATAAARAAKEVGKAEIDALLPGRDQTRDRVSQVLETVLEAAKGAATKA